MDKKEVVFAYLTKLFERSKKIGKYTYIDNKGNVILKSLTYAGMTGEPRISIEFNMSQKEFIGKMFGLKQLHTSEYIFEFIKTILLPDLDPRIRLYIS